MKKLFVATCLALPLWAAHAADATLTDALLDATMKKADPDNDGTLDLKEAAKLGISKKVFEKVNPDKDGTLDKKELAAAVTMMFEAANADKDGTLDWKEAKKAGIKSKAVFDAANPDKDGTLDVAEYLAALTAQLK
jgi:Ca2+-binding EF-hand superfamily protein